ncbi:hypothetical protein JXB11_02150 [Candidatus Woesearchaeota archaeon]|nr:hypothetical protein [Candidatus Woesearchaeota archaeon]
MNGIDALLAYEVAVRNRDIPPETVEPWRIAEVVNNLIERGLGEGIETVPEVLLEDEVMAPLSPYINLMRSVGRLQSEQAIGIPESIMRKERSLIVKYDMQVQKIIDAVGSICNVTITPEAKLKYMIGLAERVLAEKGHININESIKDFYREAKSGKSWEELTSARNR